MATAADPLTSAPEEITATVTQPDLPAETASQDQDAHKSDVRVIKDLLASQPKVRVKLAEDTQVVINGYRLLIQGGVRVEVPEGVADVLEQAGRI